MTNLDMIISFLRRKTVPSSVYNGAVGILYTTRYRLGGKFPPTFNIPLGLWRRIFSVLSAFPALSTLTTVIMANCKFHLTAVFMPRFRLLTNVILKRQKQPFSWSRIILSAWVTSLVYLSPYLCPKR